MKTKKEKEVTINRKLLEDCCKEVLLDEVMKSKNLRESLSFPKHVILCKKVTTMTYEQSVSAIFNNFKMLDEAGIRDFEGKMKKALKYGLAILAGGAFGLVTLSALAVATLYMYRAVNDPCWRACLKKTFKSGAEKKVCKYNCIVSACQSIVKSIKAEKSKCKGTKSPLKCEKKLDKEYIKWSKKLQQNLVKLQQAKAELGVRKGKVA